MKNSLEKIGLGTQYQEFVNEHIDDASFPRMSDSDLSYWVWKQCTMFYPMFGKPEVLTAIFYREK